MQPSPALWAVVTLVALPFAASGVVAGGYRFLGERTAYAAAAVALACLGLAASQYGTRGTVAIAWIPSLGVSLRFYVDGLALLVAFLASGVGVLVFVYSARYMRGEPGQARYYATLLAFMGSMLGLVLAADLVALFVFWELTSVTSFVLIGHYTEERTAREGARKSMLVTVGGGLFLLAGFVALASATGTTSLPAILSDPAATRGLLRSQGLFLPVLGLLVVGAAAKSAQVPLHVWLPDAMVAPTPVSAFLHSATMVKAGVYLLGRFRPLLLSQDWTTTLVVLGLVTMCVCAALATAADEVKRVLAYSTASHLGLLVAGFGFAGDLGAQVGALQLLTHATFKAPLFLVAGVLTLQVGRTRIDALGGLRRDLPFVAVLAAIATLSMAGIPPFNGFYSKELMLEAAYAAAVHAGGLAWLYPVLGVLGSALTVAYSLRILSVFLGDRPADLGRVERPSFLLVLPIVALVAAAVLLSLGGLTATLGYPLTAVTDFVDAVAASAVAGEPSTGFTYAFPTYLTPAVVLTLVALGLGVLAYLSSDAITAALETTLDAVPPARANWWYVGGVDAAARLGNRTGDWLEPGGVRRYASWTLATTFGLALLGYVATTPSPGLDPATLPDLPLGLVLVLLVSVVAAVGVTRAPSHVAGVLALSILGFMVAIVFILVAGPDLALTQLLVETLTLVVFLLVLNRLPAYYGDVRLALRDVLLPVLVGVTVTVTVLVATARTPDSIASYFVDHAVAAAGGHNVVNVVLVDFRALDTLGEITVVAMAAIAVVTLVAMREGGTA